MTRTLITARHLAVALILQACVAIAGTAASAQEIGTYARTEARSLNLRAGPGTGAAVRGTLPFGTSVSILDRNGTWAKVYVQGATGPASEGWVSTRFLSHRRGGRGAHGGDHVYGPAHQPAAPLRISKLDFDCRSALFGDSGIRKCVASVRVQLPRQDYDPARSDHVPIVCRGAISYRTGSHRTGADRRARRLSAVERKSIARNDRLGQSVRIDFPVRSIREKIVSARLAVFACERDWGATPLTRGIR